MEYESRIVCYFDILGFSNKIKARTLDRFTIDRIFDEITEIIETYSDKNLIITHFSDSFIVSIQRTTQAPTQLKINVEILFLLLKYKLIARGAIVFGEVKHTRHQIYGPAIVIASELEKANSYPRIILDDSVLNLILHTSPTPTTYRNFWGDFAFISTDDKDGKSYVDFLKELKSRSLLNEYKEKIEAVLQDIPKDDNNLPKFNWLKNKFDEICRTGESKG